VPQERRLILVLGTLAQHDLVIGLIGMQDSRFVFVFIVLLNQTLFTCADVLPVRNLSDIEYHVSSKDQLSWRLLQCGMVSSTDHVNDKVMWRKGTENKYEAPFSGRHKILKVNTNGTICLRVGSIPDTVSHTKKYQTPFMGASAICDFLRREDELMTELMNH
jgi:hypothetical protein